MTEDKAGCCKRSEAYFYKHPEGSKQHFIRFNQAGLCRCSDSMSSDYAEPTLTDPFCEAVRAPCAKYRAGNGAIP